MKKTIGLLLLTTVFLCCMLALPALAEEPSVGENEFTLVSFHNLNGYVKDDASVEGLVDIASWISTKAANLNVQYVGFLGQLTNGSKTSYATYVTEQGHTYNEYVAHCLQEEGWNAEFERIAAAVYSLKDVSIPYGFGVSPMDYPANGGVRQSPIANHFSPMNIAPAGVTFYSYDDCNYFFLFRQNGFDYIVFNLETYPREAILKWASEALLKYPDARAIIYTYSFLAGTGEPFHMWDWNDYKDMSATEFMNNYMFAQDITTGIKSHNIAWADKPRDGDGLWNYFLSQHDNIFLVVNSRTGSPYDGKKIVHKVLKNKAGYDVLAIVADDTSLRGTYGPSAVLATVGQDGKTVKFQYYSLWEGLLEGSGATVELSLKEVKGSSGSLEKPSIKSQMIGENTAYIKGYDNNEFRPQNNMTRAEACTIIARLLDSAESFRGQYTTNFSDVPAGQWYYDYIAYLDHFGYLTRYGTTFLPDSYITRAEFVELAYLAGGFGTGSIDASFRDVPKTHSFYEAIMAAAMSGLVNGYEDSTFRPDNTITRAEVVTIINRVLNITPKEKDFQGATVNVFGDISGHWAYYNILMASNSNVLSNSYQSIDMTGISQTEDEIIIENKYLKYIISKKNTRVTGFIDKATGKDIKNNSTNPQFCYLYKADGAKILPGTSEIKNNKLVVTFHDGTRLQFIIQAREKYITFELDSNLSPQYKGLIFAQTQLNYNLSDGSDTFSAIGYGMTYWTDMSYYPDAKDMSIKANTFAKHGARGAKLAVIAAPKNEHREIMKLVNKEMVKGDVGVSSIGGPNALDHKPNYGDYVIISDSDKAKLPEYLDLCLTYGVDQLDFHKGGATFRNGSFTFTKYASAAEFKANMADPLKKAGIQSGLHTYAYYIETTDVDILANPYWQKQIGVLETYTLSEDIGKFATALTTVEDASGFSLDKGFFVRNSIYVLVDEELMIVTATGKNTLTVTRGAGGTATASHIKGAVIKHLDGCFNMLAPDPDSELFLQIARNTAKAYNEGGFEMIYLDALDGMSRHVPSDEIWYYNAKFVNEILKYCETDPIIEYSTMYPSLWISRTRMGAWDHPRRGYRTWNEAHVKSNLTFVDRYYPTTLGWYHLYPLDSYEGNTNGTYHFFDAVDHLGTLCIAYDMAMVHQGVEGIATVPAYKKNLTQYNTYAKLRKSGYFSQVIKDKLKNSPYEFAVVEKSPGVWAFYEKYYMTSKLYDVKTAGRNLVTGNNPFEAQQPFVRIEGHFSATGDAIATVMTFDENKEFNGQPMAYTFPKELDLKNNRAFKVKVLGNNSNDSIAFRMNCASLSDSAVADYVIDLNFEGWREFVLAERDNGALGIKTYSGKGDTEYYSYIRGVFNYDRVTGITFYKSGNCNGVKISSVTAHKQISNPIVNPSITYQGKTITFNCTLNESEYLEYFPNETTAKKYDRIGNFTEVQVTGEMFTIGKGDFTATLDGTSTVENAPLRASVTFGFTGKEVTE